MCNGANSIFIKTEIKIIIINVIKDANIAFGKVALLLWTIIFEAAYTGIDIKISISRRPIRTIKSSIDNIQFSIDDVLLNIVPDSG